MDHSEIIKEAKDYIKAFEKRNERYEAWNIGGKAAFVKQELDSICKTLIENNDYFKSNLYVKYLESKYNHNGKILSCKTMKTVMLFSGNVIAQGYESDNSNEFYSVSERGFQIQFQITLSGKINVVAYGHSIENNDSDAELIESIDDPMELTSEKIQSLVIKGLKFAKSTSFLFNT